MERFDTKVQYMKYRVLKEVAKNAWENSGFEKMLDIPKKIVPGRTPSMRCCVYKERAVLGEQVKLALGGNKENPNVVEVIDIACDSCPSGGYEITNACHGCLAHRCAAACKFGAITFDRNQKAHIDKSKCVGCGMCSKACPYSAILNLKRPCEKSCKVKAISMSKDLYAQINNDKCIECGACVYQCPFGAIQDKSSIVDVINTLKNSQNNENYKVYAIVAPAIATQIKTMTLGKVIGGIKALGFYKVLETALGADMVAFEEAKELLNHNFLTSSCCPSFVSFIEKNFPQLKENISSTLSPMAMLGKYIKEQDPTGKVIFIGPCITKKSEIKKDSVKEYIDHVITFEELLALIDSKEIDMNCVKEENLDNASYFGRIFARSGGVKDAVAQAIKEQGLRVVFNPLACNGIDECNIALIKYTRGLLNNNFIEGMACPEGCIGGAGCLTHGLKGRADMEAHSKEVEGKTIKQAIESIKIID